MHSDTHTSSFNTARYPIIMVRPFAVATVLLVLLPACAVGLIEPSAFGTTPFSDSKMASPQAVPGKASRRLKWNVMTGGAVDGTGRPATYLYHSAT